MLHRSYIYKSSIIIVFVFINCFNSVLSQTNERSHKSRHTKLDTTGMVYVSDDKQKKIQAYGSLRVYMGVTYDGYFGIDDGCSRLGLTGKTNVIKGIDAFALLEVGINGINNNMPLMIFHGDPGYSVGELEQTVTSRLGAIGFETKYGRISWGKQWSPYYDVGGFTDLSLAFGGEAQGSFPNNTDGGIAGTGRAGNSLQIRSEMKNFKIALQTQFRDMSVTNVKFADTYAASLIYQNPWGISVGAAFNKVLDGVSEPDMTQTMKGDEAAIAGFFLQKKPVTIAGTFSVQKNHDQYDKGSPANYFSGNGYEFFFIYEFLKHWSGSSGINYLKPYGNEHGQYQIKYFMVGISYYFTKTSLVFIETKIEDSRMFDGTKRKSIVGFGVHYDF